jgi:glycosyltransferase involved in cell wall biosynthesis
MSRPLVSVIIPTHNRSNLLREAIESVAAQTVGDFEVIVVDDGSTEAIAAAITDHPVRPKVIRQSRQGPAAARNRGIREATADLVAFLDSDDLWHPAKLERFLSAIDADPDTRIFYGPMRPISANGSAVPGRTKPCYPGRITEKLFCSSFVHAPTVVCRKDLLLEVGGFNQTLPVCEDYDLWLRISVNEPFGLVEEPLAMRRLHADRLSKRCMCSNLAVKARVLRDFFEADLANGQLSRDVATARLARVCYVAGRAAFRTGKFRRAVELCSESRAYGGLSMRSVSLCWAARTLASFFPNGRDASDDVATGFGDERGETLPDRRGRPDEQCPEHPSAELVEHDA